jgi:hypothetical protein
MQAAYLGPAFGFLVKSTLKYSGRVVADAFWEGRRKARRVTNAL